MVFTDFISVLCVLWVIFCVVLYSWNYYIEVVLDLPITGGSPCTAHASLKQIIQKVIREALGLPWLRPADEQPLASGDDQPLGPANEEECNRTYEDLLATAILNRVIQTYQSERPSSSANSVSSRLSNSSRRSNEKEYFFSEETLDSKYSKNGNNPPDVDSTSISSLEEWVRSDSSIGSTKYVDQMSLTIRQRIEEVTSSEDEAADEDDPHLLKTNSLFKSEKGDSNSEHGDWQNNWLMQKRKYAGTASPVPVPMLVPNPTIDAKVLIGDREAEDTSDLSDVASDFGDTEDVQDIKHILLDSRTVIGGKNLLPSVDNNANTSDDGSTDSSGIKKQCEDVLNQFATDDTNPEETILEAINKTIVNEECEKHSLSSIESNTEQDTEYTEKYGTLPRTILMPQPKPRAHKNIQEIYFENGEEPVKTSSEVKPPNGYRDDSTSSDEEEKKMHFKGSYSEREKNKWNHAIEMKNNPYSTENLYQRLHGSNSSINSLFGRDYYVRQASKSAGAKKAFDQDDDQANIPFSWIGAEETENNSDEMKNELVPTSKSPEIVNNSTPNDDVVVKAVPFFIKTTPSLQLTARPKSLDFSSDSDLSVERVYNLQTGTVIEKIGDFTREVINGGNTPECVKYIQKEFDQNHNNSESSNFNETTENKKREFLRSLTQSDDDPISPVDLPPNYLNVFNDETFDVSHSTLVNEVSIKNVFNKTFDVPYPTLQTETNPYNEEVQAVSIKKEPEDVKILEDGNSVIQRFDYHQSLNTGLKGEKSKDYAENSTKSSSIVDSEISEQKEDNPVLSADEFSLDYSTGDFEESSGASSAPEAAEIVDLKDKKIVKSILGEFSKSFPNLTAIPPKHPSDAKNQTSGGVHDEETSKQTANSWKKKFGKEEFLNVDKLDAQKPVYSLTARSIPRQVIQELKKSQEPDIETVPIVTESKPVPKKRTKEEDIVITLPNARNTIKFFESLKK